LTILVKIQKLAIIMVKTKIYVPYLRILNGGVMGIMIEVEK